MVGGCEAEEEVELGFYGLGADMGDYFFSRGGGEVGGEGVFDHESGGGRLGCDLFCKVVGDVAVFLS